MHILLFYGNEVIMLILITYDVSTVDKRGAARLRKVAKACEDYGIRVQNSVFECVLDEGQYHLLKNKLLELIDLNEDSLRFYRMGKNYQKNVEHYGIKEVVDQEGILIL